MPRYRTWELQAWAKREPEKAYFLVVCDTFDFTDHSVHCSLEELPEMVKRNDGPNMTRLMGVFRKADLVECHRNGDPIVREPIEKQA